MSNYNKNQWPGLLQTIIGSAVSGHLIGSQPILSLWIIKTHQLFPSDKNMTNYSQGKYNTFMYYP